MNNDIVNDAKCMIKKFNNDSKPVTNLQIQKLMYLYEAFLMNRLDKDIIYDCKFQAWNYGPVAIPLHKEFESFGREEIKIDDDKYEMNQTTKKFFDEFYDAFKNVQVWKLVALTHREDSPWYSVWHKNGERVLPQPKSNISKVESKKWFKEVFLKDE